jgi:hypothetical protein
MSLATSVLPSTRRKPVRTRRTPARLLLVISGKTFRFHPHIFEPTLLSEQKHVLVDPAGRTFGVFEADMDFGELRQRLVNGEPILTRYHCEGCESGDCAHVVALVELGLL